MAKPIIISIFILLAVCSYCGVNFESLGRHVWRCKQKLNDRNESHNNENNDQQASQPPEHNISEVSNPINSNSTVKCCCGKTCAGLRSLKMHQRSCRVLGGIERELTYHIENETNESDVTDGNIANPLSSLPNIKKGVQLPKNDNQCTVIQSIEFNQNLKF